jgi:hypothetical protein
MTDSTIFVVGFFNTLLVCGTVGLLVWAAIEDGRRNRESRKQQSKYGASNSNDRQNDQQR